MAHELGAEAVALALYEGAAAAFEALPTQRRAALRSTAFRGRLTLAELRCTRGAYRSVRETFGPALVLARTATDHAHVWRGTSQVAYLQGDLREAVARLEAGLARLAAEATVARAMLVLEVGWCRWRQGDEGALAQRDGELALLTDLGNDLNLEACQRHRVELLRLLGREQDAAAAQREAGAARARLRASPAGGARSAGGSRS